MKRFSWIVGIAVGGLLLNSCEKDPPAHSLLPDSFDGPTAVELEVPEGFPQPFLDESNPLTEEGIQLGRKLFYDPMLSDDNSMSCATCHNQEFAFTDNGEQFSDGIDGLVGNRNSMAIINLAWGTRFFWDGRSESLLEQAFEPVTNPIEMNTTWEKVVAKLQDDPLYPTEFERVFGTSEIDSVLVVKAIVQFEMTLISGNTRYDQFIRREINFTPQERNGFVIFTTERGDCFHCHTPSLMLDNSFHNNGLDATFEDLGLGELTGNPEDNGKFKTTTLRNIEFTGPYMHDGRFETLEEVVEFYSFGLTESPTIDPLMKNVSRMGIALTPTEQVDLIAFLKTLSDPKFLTNPAFSKP